MSNFNNPPKLNIWHLTELYPPSYGGGAAIYVQEICRLQSGREHNVRVLCTEVFDDEPYSIKTDYDGDIRIDRVNIPYRGQDTGGWHLSIQEWRRHKQKITYIAEEILLSWQPDIVQFHTPYPLLEEILPSLTKRNLPIVGMLHCAWTICPRLDLIKSPNKNACTGPSTGGCLQCLYSHWDGSNAKSLAKLPWRMAKLGATPAYRLCERYNLRKHVDGLFAPSKFMADSHRNYLNCEVAHIPLGVDLQGLPEKYPKRPRTPIRFGFAGGFQEHKGIWDILDTVRELKSKGLKFELHIWGPKQDHSQIVKRGLEDVVILHGMFCPTDKWRVYAEMDVLLVATRRAEPFGRVIQEAAAMGVPTIAPNVGGITEQIKDGFDGLFFNFLDPLDLERQMTKVIEQPTLTNQLAANLWEVVDTREAVGQIEDFYYNVIGSKLNS